MEVVLLGSPFQPASSRVPSLVGPLPPVPVLGPPGMRALRAERFGGGRGRLGSRAREALVGVGGAGASCRVDHLMDGLHGSNLFQGTAGFSLSFQGAPFWVRIFEPHPFLW